MERRLYSKFRRLGYHVPECETRLRELLFDELQTYKGIYDFSESEDEPVIETIPEETLA